MQSPEQRKRIEFARSLMLSIPGPPASAPVNLSSKKARAWLPLWSTPRLAVFLPVALGLVAIIVLGTWWLRHSHTPSETRVQQPPVRREEQAPRAPGQALPQAPNQAPESQIATLILTPEGVPAG